MADVLDEKRIRILEWLSLIDFQAKHNAIKCKRVENSAIWFLECEEFNSWVSGTSNTLYCRGSGMLPPFLCLAWLIVLLAGVGKSYLTYITSNTRV
jgi:hypothetical protein